MFNNVLKGAVGFVERAIMAALLVLTGLAFAGLVGGVVEGLGHGGLLGREELTHLIDHVLLVFVLIELFAVALAYAKGERVVRTVLEASFVAVARKLIAFETGPEALQRGLALALLVGAVAGAWALLQRVGACDEKSPL